MNRAPTTTECVLLQLSQAFVESHTSLEVSVVVWQKHLRCTGGTLVVLLALLKQAEFWRKAAGGGDRRSREPHRS